MAACMRCRDAAMAGTRSIADVGAGTRYRFVGPDGSRFPDPASRYQPDDVLGASEVIDPGSFRWTDADWSGRPWEEAIIYELHIGTFTHEGTFQAALQRLDHLVFLGITAIQIMPLGDFWGRFNWGYDGTACFAPDSIYGRPDDFRRFVQAAHERSLMVVLDIVLNHFGAEGNYLPGLAPIFTERHDNLWGDAINFDGEDAACVRQLAIDNALFWLTEFNLDGLHFDAVHMIKDDSAPHILDELAQRLQEVRPQRHTRLIVENSDNQERWLKRRDDGAPVRFAAQWNDDTHHVMHSCVTGEITGYIADFNPAEGRADKLGRCWRKGFSIRANTRSMKACAAASPARACRRLPSSASCSLTTRSETA
ncbi:alpha-amylase family glycosyl hydrolase [Bosea sp. RCC_152_1]|uniref:alpha-amylase family glycosyl hydrolase n=1 Tax=Bosea sp. RCC_152_1 TaxID=3239228 RepID=UPI003524B57B